jgi:uncharacterized LabA/DUF88 family protein
MQTEARTKIAVFIDFDNIEIGVKSTLGGQFDIGPVLEALKERGEVVSKIAYGDWKRSGEHHSRALTQHAIKMVQRNLTPGGDKNGADINLALDALEMAFTHHHINTFVIVGGDSDFITLVEKLKQYDKKVFVVGGRAFTSSILQRNCHEFIAYENVVALQPPRRVADRGRSGPGPATQLEITQAFPLVRRALKVLTDREVSPQLGLLKSTLLQLDSTFSERTFGASSFRDFAEKLAAAGLVNLKHAGRNLQVELRDGEEASHIAEVSDAESAAPVATVVAPESAPVHTASQPSPDAARLAEGVAEVRRLFGLATVSPRWPMYLRNVKQFLRAVDSSFDERQWGANSLIELLRACQRDGLFRLERDRKGVLRVYPGPSLQRPATSEAVVEPPPPAEVVIPEVVDVEPLAAPVEVIGDEAPADESFAVQEEQPQPAPARRRGRAKAAGASPRKGGSRQRAGKPRTRKAKPAAGETG